MFLETFVFVLIVLICLFILASNFFEPYNNISEVLKILNFKVKSINVYINYFFTSLLYGIIVTFVVFCIYKIRVFIKDNFYISKLKYKDAKIEINGKTESYLVSFFISFACNTTFSLSL